MSAERHGSHSHEAQHGLDAHGHGHGHGQGGHHGHGHGHSHDRGHGHGHEDSNKFMTGDRYWRWPGLRETALKTSSTVFSALRVLGVTEDEMRRMDVLEIGCGGGAVTRLLSPVYGTVTAIDISHTMVSALYERLAPSLFASPLGKGNVQAFVHTITSSSPSQFSSAEAQPAPTPSDEARTTHPAKAQFDVAVIINVLHHVENPEEFFKGLQGLLKVGGKVVVVEPNGTGTVPPTGQHEKLGSEEGVTEMSDGELEAMKAHGHVHSHFFNTDSLAKIFTDKGYAVPLAKVDGTMPAQGVGRPEMEVAVIVAEKR